VAIRRCPYCKAIIDESQKYCNNCGTQLLFPEDEEGPEEDLKGEKILDEDEAPEAEEEFEASLEKPAEEPADEDLKGEKILDEDFDAPPGELEELPEPPDAAEAGIEREEIDLENALQGKAAFPGEKSAEPEPEIEPESDAERSWGEIDLDERALPPESLPLGEGVIKTAEEVLKNLGEPGLEADRRGEDESEEGDEERREADGLDFDAQGEVVQLLAELEKRKAAAASDDLPPWAAIVDETGGADAAEGEEPAEEAAEEEELSEKAPGAESFAPGDTMDFRKEVLRGSDRVPPSSATMGIPETLAKTGESPPLPPGEPTGKPGKASMRFLAEEDLEEEDFGAALEVEPAEEGLGPLSAGDQEGDEAEGLSGEPAGPDRPSGRKLGFIGSVKAFLFDTLFVVLFWLVAVALAARLMNVGLLPLVREASLSLGLLFLALWGGYFFLFLFFLGETLGRRLAASRR